MMKHTHFFFRVAWVWVVAGFGMMAIAANTVQADSSEDIWINYFQNGDTDKALGQFEQTLQSDPTDSFAHVGVALLGESRSGEGRDSLTHWLAALENGLAHPEAVLSLFESLNRLRSHAEYEQALAGFDRVLQKGGISDALRDMLQNGRSILLRRLGRWDEAAQVNQAQGVVNRFWYCGPFDNAEKRGQNRVYGPEDKLDLTTTYDGRRHTVGWRALPIEPDDGFINLHALMDPSSESTAYLVTILQSSQEQSVHLHIGHAGALKVWLNGELLAVVDRYHDIVADQVNLDGRLRNGSNTLLLKVSSGEKGRYGVYLRAVPEAAETLTIPVPTSFDTPPDLTADGPKPGQEAPNVNSDPVAIQQLKAIAKASGGSPLNLLWYAMLLQDWKLADENDTSANLMFTQMTALFAQNPLLWRLQGDSESQENRRRLAYEQAMTLDGDDKACFLKLLKYYRKSPYATEALDLIRDWSDGHELPNSAKVEQAHILDGKGLPAAAIDLLAPLKDSFGIHERIYWYRLNAPRMTDPEKRAELESILKDYPFEMQAVNDLRGLLLRQGDTAALNVILEQERHIDPFSATGCLEVVLQQQAKNDFQGSLETLGTILKISPDLFEAHRLSAVAWHQLGDDEKSLVELQSALIARPSDAWCLEYSEYLQPEEESYATPYLAEWKDIQLPAELDLSKANYLVLLNQRVVKVHPNGNSSETVHQAIKILTDTGVRYQQVRGIYYEGGTEDIRILRARVWKPDGTFYDAPAPQYRSAASAADADQRLYQDYNVAILRFQGLEKGSTVELEYKKESKGENIYADYFGDLFYAADEYFEPTVRSDYVLITPKTRAFYWKFIPPRYPASVVAPDIDSASAPQETESGTDRVWRWSFANLPTVPREPMMPAGSEILPYIKVSTFKTWSDMTEWYWNLVRDQLKPGAVIEDRLVKVLGDYRAKYQIAPGADLSNWDKVRAVNAFVNTGVRYLGLEFGIDGFKPHRVDEICNAQYGDCKDKAALAVAMLQKLGITAYMVILRTTDLGEVDYDLPSLGIFNHAIYYVPDLDGKEYWIDGTATFHDASELPSGDQGANSLIVKPGGEYEFKRIPYSPAEKSGAIFTTSVTLDSSGTASGFRVSEFRGLYNPVVRSTYENSVKAKELIDRVLVGAYPGSQSSNIEISDLKDYSTSERITYQLTVPQFAVQQSSRWVMPSTFFPESMSDRYAVVSQREYDLVLNFPWTRTNILTVTLPDSGGKVEIPQDQSVDNAFGRYSRTVKQSDNKITVTEEVVLRAVRVPKDQYPDFREFCRLIDHYQDEKISFTKP